MAHRLLVNPRGAATKYKGNPTIKGGIIIAVTNTNNAPLISLLGNFAIPYPTIVEKNIAITVVIDEIKKLLNNVVKYGTFFNTF